MSEPIWLRPATPEPVCPYCQEVQSDSWEYTSSYVDTIEKFTCGHCGKEFELSADVSVHWHSRPCS